MDIYADPFIRNEEDQHLVDMAAALADEFAKRAAQQDREGEFSTLNIERLHEAGYLKLTVPEAYGGQGISLYQLMLVQERLAEGDASTALAIGWHMGVIMSLAITRPWTDSLLEHVFHSVVQSGATINSCLTEPQSGSPSRGGKPKTSAKRCADGSWEINGHKTWTTMSPVLEWFHVTASIENEEGTGFFLIPRGTPGLSVKETWDSLGMRATGSHDLLLEQVKVPAESLAEHVKPGEKSLRNSNSSGWLLHIPACYLGIANAASRFAVRYAASFQPDSLPGPIAELPLIQDQIGRMELDLFTARTLLYHVAERWDAHMQKGLPTQKLAPQLAAAKTLATNSAIQIVDRAMRIVGGSSLFRSLPLERYYRDVRAGLHNPPMDDVTYRLLAQQALSFT
ncbi:acyl-CoA dehydrogenase family protein [Paenibacillus sp. GP183]|uniref:acyl-CoA dehydrogenase family protein n=1 Tax=Paenibacillus sp. GP183 TaxID=1882751 RepID=UPI00089807B1|nr:acyl-CoA dehydrogenase family protein [Paenibacillus sp. GP183]SEB44612.1 Acyl-CoA dehydrogenase [Paenibacillus sp. GP183]